MRVVTLHHIAAGMLENDSVWAPCSMKYISDDARTTRTSKN